MKQKCAIGICAALVILAILVHTETMRPEPWELCRAEALDYLLSQNDPETLETCAPYLSGQTELSRRALPEEGVKVGERMLLDAEGLYYLLPNGGQVVIFYPAE